jgi:hypothetical protein
MAIVAIVLGRVELTRFGSSVQRVLRTGDGRSQKSTHFVPKDTFEWIAAKMGMKKIRADKSLPYIDHKEGDL